MCGGFVGDLVSSVTDATGLTNTKKAAKGFDAAGAEKQAQREAQEAANQGAAQRKKRKASDVLGSTEEQPKKTTLGG